MKIINLNGGHTVSFFSSARELPVGHYTEFQHYMAQDAGIGSDTNAVERHLSNLTARVGAAQNNPEQLAAAADELALLHYNFQFIIGRFQPKQFAFGVLVAAVDGQPASDFTEEGLTALIASLDKYGLTQGHVEDATEDFVKKAQELAELFPARFGGTESEALLYYQQLQRRALALCDFLLSENSSYLETLLAIDEWLLNESKPEIFDEGDPRNILVLARRKFLRLCAALNAEGFQNPQGLSLIEFHSRIEFLNEKYKRE